MASQTTGQMLGEPISLDHPQRTLLMRARTSKGRPVIDFMLTDFDHPEPFEFEHAWADQPAENIVDSWLNSRLHQFCSSNWLDFSNWRDHVQPEALRQVQQYQQENNIKIVPLHERGQR